MITANAMILVMRINDYKKYSFITEHCCIMQKSGHVWMLKAGKRIPEAKMSQVINDGGNIMLRGSKASGGKYYYAHAAEVKYGIPDASMTFPDYYNMMVADPSLWSFDSLDGTWLKLSLLQEVDPGLLEHIRLVSNGRTVDEAMRSSMTSFVYARSEDDLIIG